MRLKITIQQLKEILKTEKPKFPIVVIMKNVSEEELLTIGKLLNNKK